MTVTTRVGISPETVIDWRTEANECAAYILDEATKQFAAWDKPVADNPDFANDPLARVSEILYQVAQSAKDEGRLVFAGQVIAARKIVQGLRDFAEE